MIILLAKTKLNAIKILISKALLDSYINHDEFVLVSNVLTLIWIRVNFSPCWFSLNNSEAFKAVTLTFCIIQSHFIINIFAKFSIPNLPSSLDIAQNSDGRILDFWISAQSLIKENCHNSRTSDDIDMKLGPVTKCDKKKQENVKKFDDDVI